MFRFIPESSRWIREGPLGPTLPGRVREWMERHTVAWYPSAGPSLTIPVTSEPVEATLLFGGDLALHRWLPGKEPGEVFEGVAPLLAGCDARFFNLESQFTSRTIPAGTIGTFLRADPAAASTLRYLGATAVTCANNGYTVGGTVSGLSGGGLVLQNNGGDDIAVSANGTFTFGASFAILLALKRTWGIRVEPEVETAGLDVSEHGMWGYPEFYIPVPGGYGTETHGHLRLPQPAAAADAHAHVPVPQVSPVPEMS